MERELNDEEGEGNDTSDGRCNQTDDRKTVANALWEKQNHYLAKNIAAKKKS